MIAVITEQRMRDMAVQLQDTYVNFDGSYGNQCWDSAVYINHLFGLPVINTGNTAEKSGRWPGWAGNMVDCFPQSAAIAEAYELVSPTAKALPGDTLVWDDSNSEWYPATHVATCIVDNGNGWALTLSQNSSAGRPDLPGYSVHSSGPIIQQTLPKKGLLGIIRPRTSGTGLSYAGTQITTTIEEEEMALDEKQLGDIATAVREDLQRNPGWLVFTDANLLNIRTAVADSILPPLKEHAQALFDAIKNVPGVDAVALQPILDAYMDKIEDITLEVTVKGGDS